MLVHVAHPFVLRFLDPRCPEFVAVSTDGADTKAGVDAKASKLLARRVEVHLWPMAWRGYTLCGVALDQFPFPSAVLHEQIVMQVSCSAQSEGRKPLLGVLYDEVARSVSASGCAVLLALVPVFAQAGVGRSLREAGRSVRDHEVYGSFLG